MSTDRNTQAQIEGLATILVLNDEIKKLSNFREFGFFTTNETHRLVPYHTAYLWTFRADGNVILLAQSGVAEIDVHAPTNQWLSKVLAFLATSNDAKTLHAFNIDASTLMGADLEMNLTQNLSHPLPPHALWAPFLSKQGDLLGGLVFFREKEFTEAEIKMLSWLITSYEYTWHMLNRRILKPIWRRFREKHIILGICLFILAILLFPVKLSVLGIGTVVPKNPVLINAPLHGVIKSFAVKPGEKVKKGQLLLTFDKTDLQAEAEISQKSYDLTQAKLRTAINQGFENRETRAEIPTLQGQLNIDKAHIDYTNTLLEKAEVRSPTDGLVVFDSKEDWVGQPVQTGERILVVANPQAVQLKIMLPVSNVIKLEIGSHGDFFVYGQLTSLPVIVTTLGYNAKLTPSKILAYQLEAQFIDLKERPQLGAEGSVRLYGNRVPLIYYLLRRPLQALRQSFGI